MGNTIYIKVSTGYYDTDKYIVLRQNAKKTMIQNLSTGKTKLVDTNKFLHDYIKY